MVDKRSLSSRLDALAERIGELEHHHTAGDPDGPTDPSAAPSHFCTVPELPERQFGAEVSLERVRAIVDIGSKWLNGTNLHYYFFESGAWGADDATKDVVRQAFGVWKDVGIGLDFTEVSSAADAEIRIGFQRGDGAWSYLGRDILDRGQQERTMNFGWDITVSGPNGLDTAIHEIGHTLGFPHENQNPNAGIVWDEDAVYDRFGRPPNSWSRQTTHWNIIRKIPPDTVEGSPWDPNSVMHYSFGAGLILQPTEHRNGLRPQPGLSQKDMEVVKFFYPPTNGTVAPELKPFESQMLSIAPGEQKNFNVIPSATRYYNFRTFGESDTVMVLFEADDGEFKYVKGDDDSGKDLNASFRVRLYKGRKYQLRIRLFYKSSGGETAVMMW